MKYIINKTNRRPYIWYAISIIELFVIIAFAWLAWRNARPLQCDYKYLDNSKMICERNINEVSN